MSSKVKEAEQCLKEAEKYLKTSMFKWKPDFDSAANEYQKAGTFAAISCMKDMNNCNDSVKFFEKACALFRENGIPDTAALSMERGAKMLEPKLPEKAAEFYLTAADIAMLESKNHQAAEFCGNAARIYLKLKKYEDAIDAVNKQMGLLRECEDTRPCGRLVVCQVLIHLTREDFVAAQKAFNDGKSYVEDDELYSLTQLLTGFDEMDSKQIIKALEHPFIKSLDTEYTKLARNIQQKHGAMIQSTSAPQPTHVEETVDDEAGALL
ncbi:gamma-soluble NSF attachment-like protein [Dinothrombium tinctorium]|uniref:Gamma-soluble NSF attachment protein n=1 Tax=Dinothrombium tinctorium TaxID=1965070 RepID=A0A443R789_9ACAR|nr:gamma-soluble NSF attachment-like protein [Dinothrombium tinctorium]